MQLAAVQAADVLHLVKVGVRVEEEDMLTGARHHCCSAYLTFVSVMARAGPGKVGKALPKILPGSSHQQQTFRAGEAQPLVVSCSKGPQLKRILLSQQRKLPLSVRYKLTNCIVEGWPPCKHAEHVVWMLPCIACTQ